MISRLVIGFLVLLHMPFSSASAWQPLAEPFAARSEFWSCIMPDQRVELLYRDLRDAPKAKVSWKLKKSHRTLAQGTAERTDKDELKIEFSLTGIEVNAVIELTLELTSGDRFVYEPVYLYPAEPFKNQQKLLEQANLYLFDPVGDTLEVFEAASIPFQKLDSLDSAEAIEEGLVIVGEGLAIEENEDFFATLAPLLEKGISVCFLAPDDEESESTSISMPEAPQQRVVLRRQDITKQFDERFDTNFWSAQNSVSHAWQLSRNANTILLEKSDPASGWCWIEIEYPNVTSAAKKKATLVVCGLGIVNRWNSGPMPRHLLLKMIQTYSNKKHAQ